MSTKRLFLCLGFVGLLLWSPCAASSAGASQPQRIPPIAHIAGFTVGVSTIQQMEQRFGTPKTSPGFHSNSNNAWRVRSAGVVVHANYDDVNEKGCIADEIDMTYGRRVRDRAQRRSLTFMNLIWLGMPRREVLRRLKGKLPAPQVSEGELKWVVAGSANVHLDDMGYRGRIPYTTWTATLHFHAGRLDEVDVECS